MRKSYEKTDKKSIEEADKTNKYKRNFIEGCIYVCKAFYQGLVEKPLKKCDRCRKMRICYEFICNRKCKNKECDMRLKNIFWKFYKNKRACENI